MNDFSGLIIGLLMAIIWLVVVAFVWISYLLVAIHCISSKKFSVKKKLCWVVILIAAAPIKMPVLLSCAALLGYAFFGCGTKLIKILSVLALSCALLQPVIQSSGVSTINTFVSKSQEEQMDFIKNKISTMDLSHLSQADIALLESNVDLLSRLNYSETDRPNKTRLSSVFLATLLRHYVSDDQLERFEFDDWMLQFEQRDSLDSKMMEEHLRKQTSQI